MKEALVLFLGTADTDGVTAKLQASNCRYKRKMLDSGVDNWWSIVDYFDSYNVSSVTVKLTSSTFRIFCMPEYHDVARALLEKIAGVSNLFLCHESLLSGEKRKPSASYIERLNKLNPGANIDDYLLDYLSFGTVEADVRRNVLSLFSEYGIDVIPYSRNVELTVLASAFVDASDQGLIFRIYIPSDRMWASESERLLQLFREYLYKVSGLNVRNEQYKTNMGTVHEFYGDGSIDSSQIASKFSEFSSFMDSCSNSQGVAKALLAASGFRTGEVEQVIGRYAREARRIAVDLKYERERRILNVRQELESELSDLAVGEADMACVNVIVDCLIPRVDGVSKIFLPQMSAVASGVGGLTINVNSQVIDKVNGVVARHVQGNQNFGMQAKELIRFIEMYGGDKTLDLTSAVNEISDPDTKESEKISARQRLKGFVYGIGDKIGDVAAGLLQSYIENISGL